MLCFQTADLAKGIHRRNSPIPKPGGKIVLSVPAGVVAAEDLNPRPARSPRARHIDDRHTHVHQAPGNGHRDPRADLLHDNRDGKVLHHHGDTVEDAAKFGIPFRLKKFLERIQVNGKRIRADKVGKLLHLRSVLLLRHLCSTDIAEKRYVGSHLPDHAERLMKRPVFHGLTLASHSHANSPLGTHLGEPSVDTTCIFVAPRHTGDEEREGNAFPEKGCRGVHIGKIELRQRIVLKFPSLEAGRFPPKGNVLAHCNFNMLLLPGGCS